MSKGRALKPLSYGRKSVSKATTEIHDAVYSWLSNIVGDLIVKASDNPTWLARLMNPNSNAAAAKTDRTRRVIVHATRKGDGFEGRLEKVDEFVSTDGTDVSFDKWFGAWLIAFPILVSRSLADMFKDAAGLTLDNMEAIANTASERLVAAARKQIGGEAEAWAKAHSAEMVGMKYNADGDLVANPNAIWRIDETTRVALRSLISDTVGGQMSVLQLQEALRGSYAFSSARAEVIARTEVHKANGEGALASMRASGIGEKVWLTSNDDRVEEECQANQDQGPIPVDDDFQSGDECEPAHENCRCSIAPWVTFEEA